MIPKDNRTPFTGTWLEHGLGVLRAKKKNRTGWQQFVPLNVCPSSLDLKKNWIDGSLFVILVDSDTS